MSQMRLVIPPQKNLTHQVRKQKKTENFYIRMQGWKKFNEIFDIRNKINTLQTIKQYKNYIFIIVRLRLMIMSNGVSDFVAD